MANVTIYTDGGFSYHEEIGSWGFVSFVNGNEDFTIERYGLVEHHKQTSQVAEITAILKSLIFCFEEIAQQNSNVANKLNLTIYSDSQYCVNTINTWMEGWAKQSWMVDKKNLDLWKQVHALKHTFKSLSMIWVKGHAGIRLNERVDALTQIPLEKYRK
jgi:ribonuclease HI